MGQAIGQSVKAASAVILCAGLLADSSGLWDEADVLKAMAAFDATMWWFKVRRRGEVAETGVARTRTPVDALPGEALVIVRQPRSEHSYPHAALLLLHEGSNSAGHVTQPSLAHFQYSCWQLAGRVEGVILVLSGNREEDS